MSCHTARRRRTNPPTPTAPKTSASTSSPSTSSPSAAITRCSPTRPTSRSRDEAENKRYRKFYVSCYRQYSLSVPFAERIFKLAIRGSLQGVGAGYTGQITANSFMKREFGKKLIEEYFAHQVEPDPRHRHVRCLHPRPRHPDRDPLRPHALPAPGFHHPRSPGRPRRGRLPDDPAKRRCGRRSSPRSTSQAARASGSPSSTSRVTSLAKHPWSLSGGGRV